MTRTNRPTSGKTTFHADSTVTVWDCILEGWYRGADLDDELLATLDDAERARVLAHVADYVEPEILDDEDLDYCNTASPLHW